MIVMTLIKDNTVAAKKKDRLKVMIDIIGLVLTVQDVEISLKAKSLNKSGIEAAGMGSGKGSEMVCKKRSMTDRALGPSPSSIQLH